MVTQESLWLQYMESLKKFVQTGAGEALQVIQPNKVWSWGGRDPMPNSFSYEEWMALNVVPSDPMQNTNNGAAASQSGFDQAYKNWFTRLIVGNLEHDKQYQALQDAFSDANNKYTKDYGNAQNRWKDMVPGGTPAFTDWLADPAQAGLKMQIDQDLKDMQLKAKDIDDYRAAIESPVNDIKADYSNTDYQSTISQPSGPSIKVRNWSTDPTDPYSHVMSITDSNFGQDATNGNKGSVSFNSGSEKYDYSKDYGGGGGFLWCDFIGIEGEGGFEKIQWSDFSENYSISISFQDIITVGVNPGKWFSGSNITSYKRGPYATGFSEYDNGKDNYFFGEGGSLCRIYKNMVVAYRPTITIDGSSTFSSYLYSMWEQESGFYIGPFFFGSETTHIRKKSDVQTSGGKISFKSNDDWPLIIGMVSSWTVPPQ